MPFEREKRHMRAIVVGEQSRALVAERVDGTRRAAAGTIEIALAVGTVEIGVLEEALEAIDDVLVGAVDQLEDVSGMQESMACGSLQDVEIAVGELKGWGFARP